MTQLSNFEQRSLILTDKYLHRPAIHEILVESHQRCSRVAKTERNRATEVPNRAESFYTVADSGCRLSSLFLT